MLWQYQGLVLEGTLVNGAYCAFALPKSCLCLQEPLGSCLGSNRGPTFSVLLSPCTFLTQMFSFKWRVHFLHQLLLLGLFPEANNSSQSIVHISLKTA